jgi:hypothetical protein
MSYPRVAERGAIGGRQGPGCSRIAGRSQRFYVSTLTSCPYQEVAIHAFTGPAANENSIAHLRYGGPNLRTVVQNRRVSPARVSTFTVRWPNENDLPQAPLSRLKYNGSSSLMSIKYGHSVGNNATLRYYRMHRIKNGSHLSLQVWGHRHLPHPISPPNCY